MNYTIIPLPKSEVEISVEIPFVEFEPYVKRAAVLISEAHDVKGFRRGKAPYPVVRDRFGESAIYERAADMAVRRTYPEALERLIASSQLPADRPPLGQPEITVMKLAAGDALEYKVELALLPEVTLPEGYRGTAREILKKEHRELVVSEEEVTKALSWLQESRTKLVNVDRPAAKGDAVEVDFEVLHAGVLLEGGVSKNHPLVLGKEKFLPGFEDQLIGMRRGEERAFMLVAPHEWHEKTFAGKALDFKVAMQLVEERQVPELDDAFAKNVGNFSSLEAFRESIRQGIAEEKREKEKQRIRGLVAEAIAHNASLEIPEVLVHGELKKMIEELRGSLEGVGMQWEAYLTEIKKTIEDLMKEWRDEAIRRVRIALCLREIARREKIEPTEEEIKKAVDQYLNRYRRLKEAERAIDPRVLEEYTRGILKNEKVFEFLEAA